MMPAQRCQKPRQNWTEQNMKKKPENSEENSPNSSMKSTKDEEQKPILIRVSGNGNTTGTPDEPDDARHITVDTEEEKEYLEFLKEKEIYSVKGLVTKLAGMRDYKNWKNQN